MDSPNPYQSPAGVEAPQEVRVEVVADTLGGAALQGIRLGWKWITIILGPVAFLMLLVSIGITVYVFFVKGLTVLTDPALRWQILQQLGRPFGFYLVCCMWGIIGGLLVCVPLHLIRRITRKPTIMPAGKPSELR